MDNFFRKYAFCERSLIWFRPLICASMRSYVYLSIKYFKSICVSEGYKSISLSGIIGGNCNIFASL